MNEQNKKQIIIVAVLAVLLVGVLVYQLVLAGDPPPSSGSAKTGETTSAAAPARRAAARPVAAVSMLEETEIDIDELTQSVEVQPIDYSAVRIARNPMTPLVGIPDFVDSSSESGTGPGGGIAPPPIAIARREVTGIIWDSQQPVAIIDNMVVHEGYVFADGVVVQEIEPTRVLLLIGDNLRPLEMKDFGK